MTVGEISLLIGLILNAVAVVYAAWLNYQRFGATIEALETIKKQTDGVVSQVTALAKATGHLEGTQAAVKVASEAAAILALGQQQGRDAERESIAAKAIVTGKDSPLPVMDKITNETGERAAQALESMANTAQKTAESAKK